MIRNLIILLIVIFCWISCGVEDRGENEASVEMHYPVGEYYDSLATKLDGKNVIRVIYKDGTLFDSSEVSGYDFTEDMNVLKKADISASSLDGKYTIDRSTEGDLEKLKYTLKPDLDEQVKELTIWLEDEVPVWIKSDRSFESVIASIRTRTSFRRDDGYEINSVLTDKISGSRILIDKKVLIK